MSAKAANKLLGAGSDNTVIPKNTAQSGTMKFTNDINTDPAERMIKILKYVANAVGISPRNMIESVGNVPSIVGTPSVTSINGIIIRLPTSSDTALIVIGSTGGQFLA